jgi:hypothetical protein
MGAPVGTKGDKKRAVIDIVRRALSDPDAEDMSREQRVEALLAELEWVDPKFAVLDVTTKDARLYFASQWGPYRVAAHLLLTSGACGIAPVDEPARKPSEELDDLERALEVADQRDRKKRPKKP